MRGVVCALLAALLMAGGAGAAPAATVTAAASDRFDAMVADAKAAMLTDPHGTLQKTLDAEHFAGRQPASVRRSIMQATAKWLRSEAYSRLNDLQSAKPLIAQALALTQRYAPGSRLQGDALLNSGWINVAQGDVADALADYTRAHDIFQALGEVRSQSKALQSIGSLYRGGNDFRNALKYFDQALALYHADPLLALTLYNNRASALKSLERYPEAEAQFAKALTLTEQMKSPMLRVLVLGNIAETRLSTRDVAGAQRAIDEGLRLSRRGEGAGYRKMLIGLSAQAAFQRGDLPLASRLIGERFQGEDLDTTTLADREAHRTAYVVYGATGKHDMALQHLVALKRLDDEATTLARSTNAALMAARFDFANQELKIANLQRDEARRNVAFEQARTRTQRNMFFGIAAATALVVAMLGFGLLTLRRSRNQVRDANAGLAVTNSALSKALAAKTEFLATTSHEIRTPLNGILGMTEVMLADGNIPEATRDRLTVVHSAGVTMRSLVDDILDVAKMETGNLVIEEAPFDLRALLSGSLRLWEDQAEAKGLTFRRELDECPGPIVGDAARIRQIVFNLMSNALKFTGTGSVSLRVASGGDDRLSIIVADTGVGIPADKREEIFESFRQADTSTTRQFGGTGLGLAICRNLARAMGGDVRVESEAGAGARFIVDLPLVAAVALDDGHGCRPVSDLLVIDRNPITRAMLKTLMMPHMGEIATAASLDEGVSFLQRERVERVLVDATTLTIGGDTLAATERLIASAPCARITMLWPATLAAERLRIVHYGQIVHVIKPVAGAALADAIVASGDVALVSQAA